MTAREAMAHVLFGKGKLSANTLEQTDRILAALAAAGWAVVPREATEAMVAAARDPRTANGSPVSKGVAETWRAMIGAGGVG